MPYNQIIAVLMALILVSGAPTEPASGLTAGTTLWLALGIPIAWVGVIFAMARQHKRAFFIRLLSGRLQWLTFLPFLFNLYVLDIKVYLAKIPGTSLFPTWLDLLGLGVYAFYFILAWLAIYIERSRAASKELMRQELWQRFRLFSPLIFPYFLLSLFSDLLHLLPWQGLQDFLDTPEAEASYFGLFFLVLLLVIPPAIKRLWSCSPLPDGPQLQTVNAFLRKEKMRFAGVLLWPLVGQRSCTAAVVGLLPRWRYILITPCLLDALQPEEMEAVLAHEIGHVRFKHLLWYVLFLAAYSLILFQLLDPVWTWLLSRPLAVTLLIQAQDTSQNFIPFVVMVSFGILFVVYFRFLMGYFMRHFERQADLHAVEIQGQPWAMITALEKVGWLAGGVRDEPSWHHFSIAERVRFLASTASDPAAVTRFQRKIAWSKGLFIGIAACLFSLPLLLPTQTWEKTARGNILSIYLDQVLQHGAQKPEWYVFLGQFLMERGEYAKAEHVLQQAENLFPQDPEILNSMAWFYATVADPGLKDPKRALALARKAVQINPAPHILDTLAESLFQNHEYAEAVAVEKRALEGKPERPHYYHRQIRRFEDALRAQTP